LANATQSPLIAVASAASFASLGEASEWRLEHRIVSEPEKPKFDSWGKILLLLHRSRSGRWLLSREVWNHSVAPMGRGQSPHK
jgi:hypothetical protein